MNTSQWSLRIQCGVLVLVLLGLGYWTWQRSQPPSVATFEGRPLAQWLEDLSSADYNVSDKAADVLVGAGTQAVPPLLEARRSGDIRLHRRAAAVLVRIGPPAAPGLVAALTMDSPDRVETELVRLGPDAVPALVAALKDEQVAKHAAHVLGLIGPRPALHSPAVPALVEILKARPTVPGLREEAAVALGLIGTPAEEVVPALVGALRDANPVVRQRAADALGEVGSPARQAVPALAALLDDEHTDVAGAACTALARIGDAGAATALLRTMQGNRGPVADAAGRALAHLGPAAKEVVPAVLKFLSGSEKEVIRARFVLQVLGPVALPGLIQALGDAEPSNRRAAAEMLGVIGPVARPAVPALAAALQDKTPRVALDAAWALARIDPTRAQVAVPLLADSLDTSRAIEALADMGPEARAAVPKLIEALRQREGAANNKAFRTAAQVALARVGTSAVPDLVRALRDKREGVSPLAGEVLGLIVPPPRDAVPALLDALERDRAHAESYVRSLARIGAPNPDAVPRLTPLLADPAVRAETAVALIRIDPGHAAKVMPDLIQDLQASQRQRREATVRALAELGPAAKSAVPVLAGLLRDKELQEVVLAALGRIGPAAQEAVPALLTLVQDRSQTNGLLIGQTLIALGPGAIPAVAEVLKDPDPVYRFWAASVLAGYGADARAALTPLLTALKDPTSPVRGAATLAVGQIGAEARDAVPDLMAELMSFETDIRRDAALALQKIGPAAREARRPLLECLLDPNKEVRRFAAWAVGYVDPKYVEAVPILEAALYDQYPGVRLAATESLIHIDPPKAKAALPMLHALCRSTDPEIRLGAVQGLQEVDPEQAKQALPMLTAELYSENLLLRPVAATWLVRIAPDQALQAVLALLSSIEERDPRVRLQVAQTLGELGKKAREAVPALRRLLQDDVPEVRREAIKALQQIDPEAARRAGVG
jgi:HEAT repeat protein